MKMMLAVCVVVAALASPASFSQPTIVQDVIRSESESGDMQCISYCSVTQRGTPLMEVKWRLADRSLNDAELRAKLPQQAVDVTVYSEGFERGLFATVPAVKPKATFRAQTAGRKMPGVEKLSITDVATRLSPAASPLRLLAPAADTPAGEWETIRLEGLDPGMEYTYRVRGGQSSVKCRAIVCPADLPIPRNRANRNLNN